MDLSSITKLPPKRLALIAAGGIGAGLLWRKFSNRSASTTAGMVGADGNPIDISKLALAQNSAGNLATGTSDAVRDVGQGNIPLPSDNGTLTQGPDTSVPNMVTIGGVQYPVDQLPSLVHSYYNQAQPEPGLPANLPEVGP